MSQVVFDTTLSRTLKTQSCDHCFVRKIKCDRLSPCSSCAGSGALCTYDRRRTSRKASRLGSRTPSVQRTGREASPRRPDEQFTINNDHQAYTGDPVADDVIADPFVQVATAASMPDGQHISHQLLNATEAAWSAVPAFDLPPSPIARMDAPSIFQDNAFLWSTLYTSTTYPVVPHEVHASNIPPSLSPLEFAAGVTPFLDDPAIPLLVDIFVERLQPTMPFFKRAFLRQNVERNRHLTDPAFGSLVHAICSLTLFQPIQSQDKRVLLDRDARAEGHLALAVHLHSRPDHGQQPSVEAVMASIFLFACNFCKGNHDAAHIRLREASALAEMMELHRVDRYGDITPMEKDRRIRTYMCLTIIERIYSIQREYPLYPNLLSGPRAMELREAIDSSPNGCDDEDLTAIEGLGNMLDQVEFIDPNIVRCWKDTCWLETPGQHVSAVTVLALLRRYKKPPMLARTTSKTEAQHADILITRHWVRNKVWNLGFRHGYINRLNADCELRPSYALSIASDAIATSSKFEMSSLETHGIGLAEKFSDIATSALQMTQSYIASSAGSHTPPTTLSSTECSPGGGEDITFDGAFRPNRQGAGCMDEESRALLGSAEEMFNKYLALFASFRAGKHAFLRPYMRLLCSVDFPD